MMRKNRVIGTVVTAWLLACVATLEPQSLWDPSFDGYISDSSGIEVGGTLVVVLDTDTSLEYDSSRVTSERISIELTGGEGGDLFSFLPSGNTGSSSSVSGSDSLAFNASLAVRIIAVDDDGRLQVQGSRTISLGTTEETITVAGLVDPRFVDESGRVPASSIVDLSLVYTGVLDPSGTVLGSDDIVRTEIPAATGTPAATEAVPATETPVEAADAPGPSETEPAPAQSVELSEEAREELLLRYLNRMIDLILRGP